MSAQAAIRTETLCSGELGADRPDFDGRKPRVESLATKRVVGPGDCDAAPRAACEARHREPLPGPVGSDAAAAGGLSRPGRVREDPPAPRREHHLPEWAWLWPQPPQPTPFYWTVLKAGETVYQAGELPKALKNTLRTTYTCLQNSF